MTNLHSYPKLYNLGHPAITELFDDPVVVQEKVDGSQFSFMCDDTGTLHFRSKGAAVMPETADGLFGPAVKYLMGRPAKDFHAGYIYRGETLCRPKHNTLTYDRAPCGHVALFDVERSDQNFLDYEDVCESAHWLGVDVVPRFSGVDVRNVEDVQALLTRDSFLGGTKVEGVVFKNYTRFGKDGKALMGKYVSEAFKEKHTKEWKIANPGSQGIIVSLTQTYRTEARWRKAIQHLAEAGQLEWAPQDIGKLLRELHSDFDAECSDEVKTALYKWASGDIKRGLARGFPEFYKSLLMERQFEGTSA